MSDTNDGQQSSLVVRAMHVWSARIAAVVLAPALLLIAVDQLTKSWALSVLDDGPNMLFGDVGFRLAFNRGAAFSTGSGATSLLTAISLIALVILAVAAGLTVRRLTRVGVMLVFAGAAGNVVDRLFRGHDGAVVDFLDVGFWPIFNVADVCIVCGCGLLVWSSLRSGKHV